jgi:hypothetical protein
MRPIDVSTVPLSGHAFLGPLRLPVDVADVRADARAEAGARLREPAGTHALPLQYPDVMLQKLRRLSGSWTRALPERQPGRRSST